MTALLSLYTAFGLSGVALGYYNKLHLLTGTGVAMLAATGVLCATL